MVKRVTLKGRGAELFFGADDVPSPTQSAPQPPPAQSSAQTPADTPRDHEFPVQVDQPAEQGVNTPALTPTVVPSSEDLQLPRRPGTKTPRHRGTAASITGQDVIETIRRAVRHPGKEAATYRYSREEKRALGEIVHEYKQRDIRTSGNELARIGVNWLLEDYRLSGPKSVLARVLSRLNR